MRYTFTHPSGHGAPSVMFPTRQRVMHVCVCVRVCRAESKPLCFSCILVFHHQRALLTLNQLRNFHISLLFRNIFKGWLFLSFSNTLANNPLDTPSPLPSPSPPLHELRCPLCQPSIREGYEGSALLRGSSPRWILRLPPRPLMVKGEPARSQMDPLQAGRHTDWLSLKKHHLCVPTGGGCN